MKNATADSIFSGVLGWLAAGPVESSGSAGQIASKKHVSMLSFEVAGTKQSFIQDPIGRYFRMLATDGRYTVSYDHFRLDYYFSTSFKETIA
jgi:hypothetical protein